MICQYGNSKVKVFHLTSKPSSPLVHVNFNVLVMENTVQTKLCGCTNNCYDAAKCFIMFFTVVVITD